MAKNCFNVVDILIALVSLATFVLDVGTDIFVCTELLLVGQKVWGWLMVVFIVVPAILMSLFSLYWHIHDKTVTPAIIVSHLLLVAPVERYLRVIYLGIKSYRTQKVVCTQKALRALSDVSILRLIEAFLESAPQLVLQLYILLCKRNISWLTGISFGCSLVSLTWTMTAYCDTQSRGHNITYSHRLFRLVLHWCWQLFMTVARIAAFVFFACALHSWVIAVMGGHWLVAFVWISIRGTDFGTGYERWLFRLVCAFIYIFVFLNLNKGNSRWRITAYYIMVLLENTGMLAVFLVMEDNHMILVSCLVVFAGFFIGLACMLIYYAFLHPSGPLKRIPRLFQPHLRSVNISGSSCEIGPQIFSIESPKPATLKEGNSVHLSPAASSSQNSLARIQQIDESLGNFVSSVKTVKSSKQTLEMAWQSGMGSSSNSSSSSLASTENPNCLIKRTSSIKSDNSQSSTYSDNHMLPLLLAKNCLGRSPRKMSETERIELDYLKQGGVGESDDVNVLNGGSQSPTLSRNSWTRVSDQNMQPLVFNMLGFDESSSTGKRVSDSSSFSSQQKSLSPLDVSHLWNDAHVRLRATIAATIAAATGSLSSNECTPNKNQSVLSYSSAVSGHDDSLNSTLSHNTAFMDSGSSYREKCNISQQSGNQDSSRHREALSTLPQIIETFDTEELSDSESQGKNYEKSAGETMGNKIVREKIPAEISMNNSSQYPLDSTLTVSKLDIQKSSSYLASQKRRESNCQSAHASLPSRSENILSFRSPVQNPLSVPSSNNKEAYKGDSPFTDQELVSVMAKSLQNYIAGSASVDSNNPEREGLALTLEDLRLSRESTPEPSPSSHKIGEAWKSRSTSSLFHDSMGSSPPSSASKMNQATSILNADAKLSPNALKQIEDMPQRPLSLGDLQKVKDSIVAIIPHSHALKFIIDSYESTALSSPRVASPTSRKPFYQTPTSTIPTADSQFNSRSLPHIERKMLDCPSSPRNREDRMMQRRSFEKGVCPININTHKNFHPKELLDSSAWKISKTTNKNLEIPDKVKHTEVRGGISSTKKLNVHFSGLKSSPFSEHTQQEKEADSELECYVSGQYCPPLCGKDAINDEQQFIQQKLQQAKRNSKHDSACNKSVLEHSSKDKKPYLNSDFDILDSLHQELARKDSKFEKHRSHLISLQKSETTPLSQKCQSPKSYSFQQHHSSEYQHDSKKLSSHSFCMRPGNRTLARSHAVDELTEDELHSSAKHVAEYFSEALETNPDYGIRPRNLYLQPQLQVHGSRQPLQRLENSQLVSPESYNYKIHKGLGIQKQSSHPPNKHLETKYVVSPEVCTQMPGRELHRKHLLQYTKDSPKAKLLFETSEPNKILSLPPLNEARKAASGLSIRKTHKSNTKVHFAIAEDQDEDFSAKTTVPQKR